jgi:hypothetical protein
MFNFTRRLVHVLMNWTILCSLNPRSTSAHFDRGSIYLPLPSFKLPVVGQALLFFVIVSFCSLITQFSPLPPEFLSLLLTKQAVLLPLFAGYYSTIRWLKQREHIYEWIIASSNSHSANQEFDLEGKRRPRSLVSGVVYVWAWSKVLSIGYLFE